MNDLQRQNDELYELLDEAMDIAGDAIIPCGIFITQRFSRLREAVRQFKEHHKAGDNIAELKK